jgi:hypothetical protein
MRELITAKRPLILGIGGGGDVVGALATAEYCRLYHGADPIVGGVTWERRPIDPVPGPRRAEEIENATEIAPGVLAAGSDTKVRGRDVLFAESRMAGLLGVQTVLVDVHLGPARLAESIATAVAAMEADLVVFLDVGGDALAHGDEPGLGSPLCDAVMLAAAHHLAQRGVPVLGGIYGTGCDGELTPTEVLERLAEVATAGGLRGAIGITADMAPLLEQAIQVVPTEASALALRAFQGERGEVPIREGRRTVLLSPIAALTFYFSIEAALATAARLAFAVLDAADLDEANAALDSLGVRTELDWERDADRNDA